MKFLSQIPYLSTGIRCATLKYSSLINKRFFTMATLNFREIEGDLFSAPEDHAFAHCVAADMNMDAGVAVQFRDRYNNIEQLKGQNVAAGGVAVLKHNSRFIYYLVSKQKTFTKPTYDDLFSSLQAMKQHMKDNGVTKVAMPRIGAGLDGLEWDKVKDKIHEAFSGEPIDIVVYVFSAKKA